MKNNNIAEVMNKIISPKDLAQEKFNAYLEFCCNRLDDVKEMFKDLDVDSLSDVTFISPAGDCMGLDNICINFSYDNYVIDVNQAFSRLLLLYHFMNDDITQDDFDRKWSNIDAR